MAGFDVSYPISDLVAEIETLGNLTTVCTLIRVMRARNRVDRQALLKYAHIVQQETEDQCLRIAKMIVQLESDELPN